MNARALGAVMSVIVALGATATSAQAGGKDKLDAYGAIVSAAQLAALTEQGIDISAQRNVEGGIRIDLT